MTEPELPTGQLPYNQEPVVDLTPEEQCRKEENPDLTLDKLLALSSCEDHIRHLFKLWTGCKSAQLIFALGTGGQEIG